MVKMLYSTRKTFSDFKTATGLEAASVNNHLKSLLNMGLVSHSDEGGYELTKRGRLLVRTLASMLEAIGGVQMDTDRTRLYVVARAQANRRHIQCPVSNPRSSLDETGTFWNAIVLSYRIADCS